MVLVQKWQGTFFSSQNKLNEKERYRHKETDAGQQTATASHNPTSFLGHRRNFFFIRMTKEFSYKKQNVHSQLSAWTIAISPVSPRCVCAYTAVHRCAYTAMHRISPNRGQWSKVMVLFLSCESLFSASLMFYRRGSDLFFALSVFPLDLCSCLCTRN